MAVAIVAGALANKPRSGGEAWVRLSWALGLRRLGFDVWLVEEIAADDATAERVAWFDEVTARFGLPAALIVGGGERVHGASATELCDAARSSQAGHRPARARHPQSRDG